MFRIIVAVLLVSIAYFPTSTLSTHTVPLTGGGLFDHVDSVLENIISTSNQGIFMVWFENVNQQTVEVEKEEVEYYRLVMMIHNTVIDNDMINNAWDQVIPISVFQDLHQFKEIVTTARYFMQHGGIIYGRSDTHPIANGTMQQCTLISSIYNLPGWVIAAYDIVPSTMNTSSCHPLLPQLPSLFKTSSISYLSYFISYISNWELFIAPFVLLLLSYIGSCFENKEPTVPLTSLLQ